jgi:S1-C subfamily serine protease
MLGKPTPVVVHLSGALRGTTHRLRGSHLRIGAAPDAEIRLPPEDRGDVGAEHAVLELRGERYTLRVAADHRVWVNGEPAREKELASGDLLEIGEDGPLLRFRLYPAESRAFKTIRQALSDCYETARREGSTPLGRAWIFLSAATRELAREISPAARWITVLAFTTLVLSVGLLAVRNARLSQRLEEEAHEVDGLRALLESSERESISVGELAELRSELEGRIASTAERIDYLEQLAGAAERTIAEAARSVIFLQGSYGFLESASGERLRWAVSPSGQPLVDGAGNPRVTTAGDGPPIEALFTGTGFVASRDGLVLTNRHVALPWEFDEMAQQVLAQGLEPVMTRMIGYLPGIEAPFDVTLVVASNEADLAVLRCGEVTGEVRSLSLSAEPPRLGEAVLVLGFPTGIQAMMARADRSFLLGLGDERLDFWEIAQRLSAAGQIGPLATSGIIGQVTESSIVYDADTTSGGSGGPVLTLDGRVVAINSAILRQFGGSNLGVPADLATRLLAEAGQDDG